MSGSLRIVKDSDLPGKHDHVDINFDEGYTLRYRDPRRFGCVLWQAKSQDTHSLLINLGPEPLENDFGGRYLFSASRKRSISIKPFIMNSNIVVGVGNIYANEALFLAGINPKIPSGKIIGSERLFSIEVALLTKQPSIASDLFISALAEIEADLVAQITTVILEVELGQLESTDGREKLTGAIRDHVNQYLEEDLNMFPGITEVFIINYNVI